MKFSKQLGQLLSLPMWAWTTPAAFDNGSVISAADMDTITDDLTFLGDLKSMGKSIKNYSSTAEIGFKLLGSDTDSTDRTTTSTSFADMSGLSVTATVNSSLVLAVLRVPVKIASGTANLVTFTLKHGSTTLESSTGIAVFQVSATYPTTCYTIYNITGLTSGNSYTFVPRWKVDAGTATASSSTTHPSQLDIFGG